MHRGSLPPWLTVWGALALTGACSLRDGGARWWHERVDVPVPWPAPGFHAASVAIGSNHACALTRTGAVWCWGDNGYGQLGDGTTHTRTEPAVVPALPSVQRVVSGFQHTCALTLDGAVFCWGENRTGQVGDGTTVNRPQPTRVQLPLPVTALTAGPVATCARTTDGATRCWGQLLPEPTGTPREPQAVGVPVPRTVHGPPPMQAVALGFEHACGVSADGSVWCWGTNTLAQLGDGTADYHPVPIPVQGIASVTSLAAGTAFTCALAAHGIVPCWGHGATWLADTPGAPGPWPVATVVDARTDAVGLAAVNTTVCVRTQTGGVRCAGDGRVQVQHGAVMPLGHGMRDVAGLAGAVDLWLGPRMGCVRRTDDTLACFAVLDRAPTGLPHSGLRHEPQQHRHGG